MAADPLIRHLNEERLLQNLTPGEWAKTAGVSVSAVHRLIRDESGGQIATLRDLAAVLGLELWVRPIPPQARRVPTWAQIEQRRRVLLGKDKPAQVHEVHELPDGTAFVGTAEEAAAAAAIGEPA